MIEFENVANEEKRDASKCALCGGPNQCALAADPSAEVCWCDAVEFPEELLAQVPAAAKRIICVCQECLASYQQFNKAV